LQHKKYNKILSSVEPLIIGLCELSESFFGIVSLYFDLLFKYSMRSIILFSRLIITKFWRYSVHTRTNIICRISKRLTFSTSKFTNRLTSNISHKVLTITLNTIFSFVISWTWIFFPYKIIFDTFIIYLNLNLWTFFMWRTLLFHHI